MAYLVNIESSKLLVRTTLLSSSTVTDLVSSRVWGAHIQEPDAKTVDYPMVIIDFTSGRIGHYGEYELITMDLYAYSRKSAGNSLEIYQACFAALQNGTLRKDGVPVAGYSVETVRPVEGWNESVRAYFAQGEWAVRLAHRELS